VCEHYTNNSRWNNRWREEAARNSIKINKMVSTTTTTTTNNNNCHNQKKHRSMKDLLYPILITAPVFHAEMSELKAELERNTTQTKAGRTTICGGRRR